MISQTDYKSICNARIDTLLKEYRKEMTQTHVEFGLLLDELRTLINRGGKRMRPYLSYVGYSGYGGQELEKIIDVGVALEFIHLFLLIHDDLIDQDTIRYGDLNITGSYTARLSESLGSAQARQAAEGVALLGGDVMQILAQRTLLNAGLSPEQQLGAINIISRMTLDVAAGELLDLILPLESDGALTFTQVHDVYVHKTAGYSIVAPLQLGNLLAGGLEEERSSIAAFGIPLGVAYQIKDDLLGMFAEEKELGKSNMSDMRQGKHTPLYLCALELASPAQHATLSGLYGNSEATPLDLEVVRRILISSGAQQKTQELMETHADTALAALHSLSISHSAHEVLEGVVASAIQRTF